MLHRMIRRFLALSLALLGCNATMAPEDVKLDPPARGLQFTSGAFDVAAGAETQRCYFFTIPGTEPVWVSRVTLAQNTGSHHFNVFRVATIKALDGNNGDVVIDGECFRSPNWSDWPLVINSQNSEPGRNVVDWTLPSGVALKFMPGEKIMLQSHYVNASTQKTPGKAKAIVNFHFIEHGDVTAELGTAFATNQQIRPCPGDLGKVYENTCRFAKHPVTIVGANGHFHSRGRKFEIASYDSVKNEAGPTFYSSTSWDDPPFLRDLKVNVPAMGGIQYRCTFDLPANQCCDQADGCCCKFGPKVETNEHCNAFVYYYPKSDNVNCF
jgi:hypothetical protein